ncbi:MAG: fibronectin type III domain-containing protein [Microbacteriaceae bacterium]|nr:fibronectin type III domain-containing protein [Microbacteriaceae bacterium]
MNRATRVATSATAAAAFALGGVLVASSPALAATPVASTTDLNSAIAAANLGGAVEVELTGGILLDGDLAPLTAGSLTIDGNGFTITSTGGYRLFDIGGTASFTANELRLDAAAGGPAIEATGISGDAGASPTVSLTDVEAFGASGFAQAAVSVTDAALSISGASYFHDSVYGLDLAISFGTATITGLRTSDTDECGLGVTVWDATFTASGLDVSGAGCAGLALSTMDPGSVVTISDSTFSSNYEGALVVNYGGTIDLRDSRITGSADVQLDILANDGETRVTNVTIDDGRSPGTGYPVVFVSQNWGDLVIAHSTITGNEAVDLPVVGVNDCGCGGSFRLDHTIVAGNALSGTAADVSYYANPVTPSPQELSWSLIGTIDPSDAAYALATDPANDNLFDPDDPIDPELGPAQNNGGPTSTRLPLAGSPVVDAGDPDFAPPPTADARGMDRVSGLAIDLGAAEAQFPGTPTDLVATPGDAEIGLAWTAPASGDSPITDYIVEFREVGAPSWFTFLDGTGTATATTVTGLTNDTDYEFRVYAESAYGPGGPSAPVTATPSAVVPGIPTDLTAAPGNAEITLNWSPPLYDGGSPVTGYRYEYRALGDPSWIAYDVIGATNATQGALTRGTTYEFRIAATNAIGTGAFSDPVQATPPLASLHLSRTDGKAGDEVTVTGSYFDPAADVSLVLHSTPVALGTRTISPLGTFSLTFVIPADVPPGAHTVTASVGGSVVASAALNVTAAALPVTGDTAQNALPLGLLLLLTGALALVAARRRPSTRP